MARSTVDIREVIKGIGKLDRAARRDSALFWKEAQIEAKAEIRSHRRSLAKRDPDTPGTGPVLGKALTAYRVIADESGLLMLSLIDYSLVLNDGGVVGNKARLPRREFAFWSDPFVATVADKWARFVVRKGWTKSS